MRFQGLANVTCIIDPNAGCAWQFTDVTYDESTNWSYLNMTMPAEKWHAELNLMLLNFTDTRRNFTAPLSSGITNITLMLPNHTFADADITLGQYFSNNLISAIKSVKAFKHARFMGAMNTNYQAGYYGEIRVCPAVLRENHSQDHSPHAETAYRPGWSHGSLPARWSFACSSGMQH